LNNITKFKIIMLSTIRKKINIAALLLVTFLGNVTLVGCGGNSSSVSPNSNSIANSVPSVLNTVVFEEKTYSFSGTGNIYCDRNALQLLSIGQNSIVTGAISLGGNNIIPNNITTTYNIMPTTVLFPGQVYLVLAVGNTSSTNPAVRQAIGESGTVSVSFENGKIVAKYSGVKAKVYERIGSGTLKEVGTTILAGYVKCP
jgi:hypothetical protein